MLKKKPGKKYVFINVFIGIFCFALTAFTQELPKEIRGYKVYNAKISVKNKIENTGKTDESEAFVKVGEPDLIDVSLTGITFAVSAEIASVEQSGTIDFLTFHDFRVNNLAVEVEEYKKAFAIKKNQTIVLPETIKIFLGAGQTLHGALSELKESKDEWTITGRVFVFGHFKKSFLKFKRVVPVEINLKIKNPLKITSK